MFSGDGGWALLDRAVMAELAKNGLSTVGWDSLSYFWKARQPDEMALDLERVLHHYLENWKKDRIVLIGHSFGANVLPAVVSRLPKALRDRLDLVAFLGLSELAAFEFRLTNWLSDEPSKGDQPVRPELEKLSGINRLCIYGAEETGALCPKLADLGVITVKLPGDHHFDEDYSSVARRILDQLPPPPPAKP
jgi:type IV secretory pathway VirJ component